MNEALLAVVILIQLVQTVALVAIYQAAYHTAWGKK